MRLPVPIHDFMVSWVLGGLGTVAGLALLTGLALRDHGWWGYLRLVDAGVMTRAVVVRIDRGNHCLVEYTFVTEGQSHSGSGAECTARVGQGVTITYLRSNPRQPCLGRARDALANELATFAVGGLIFPPFVLVAVRRWGRRSRAGSTVS